MSTSFSTHLAPGDRAPAFLGISAKGAVYSSEEQTGRAAVLLLAKDLSSPHLIPLLEAFSARADEFSNHDVDLVALIGEDVEKVLEFDHIHPSRINLVGDLNDFLERNKITYKLPDIQAYSPSDFLVQIGCHRDVLEVLVLDRNMRVAGRSNVNEEGKTVATTLAITHRLPHEAPRDVCTPAPVLILPNLLDLDLCRELIDMHETGVTTESPAFAVNADNHMHHKLDYRLKKRRDYLLDRDHPMHIRITDILARRCIPEIKRSFQADVSHTDRINIACYPGDGGHFRRHRDNRPEIVSYRKFALSINLTLSADGYEGGYLQLPEFNSHHYRCPPGAGIIFSVALLHEITPVLRGNRYVLVTHLHDDQGEIKWQEMRARLAKMDQEM